MDRFHMIDEKSLTPASIAKLQTQRFKEIVGYCKTNSPYYRQKLASLDIRDVADISDIALFPFTTKDALSFAPQSFLCIDSSRIVDVSTTSGTTGKPLMVKLTETDLQRLAFNEYLSFTAAGLTRNDTVILAVTMDKCFIAGLAYFLGLSKLGATILRVGPASPEMLLRLASDAKATAIVGVPSYLLHVCEYARKSGISVESLRLQKLICIGEPVRNKDLSLNATGLKLARYWKSAIYSTYGITELAISFCECAAGKGGHLHPELLHVEIVDDSGHALGHGKEGEIVATTFGINGMPLIRYKTGDISFTLAGKCKCGLRTLRLGPIIARKQQKLKLKGTTIYPRTIIDVLERLTGVLNYVIIATANPDLSDNVEILIALDPALTIAEVKEKLKGALKVSPKITRTQPELIEKLKFSSNQRKKTSFIDKR